MTSTERTVVAGGHIAGAPANTDDMPTSLRRTVIGRLEIIDGPGAGTTLIVHDGTQSIGRDRRNGLALSFGDAAVHRRDHAFIVHDAGRVRLFENGKANPIKLNGTVIVGSADLRNSDLLQLGRTTLRYSTD
jgi:hypothetical protein